LGDVAHGEVFAHQELDQGCILGMHGVVAAKTPHFAPTQRRMVAPTPLGNVMEQSRHIQHPGLVPARSQL
jgi:hypothetical protein